LPAPDELIYTVSELTRRVKRLLESHWAALWVEGELSNVKLHTSGHLYFTLKDEQAALRGVMFRAKASRLRFEPEDGQKVRVFGGLTVYERQGSYQILATKLDPLGVGELEIAFRQTFARLEKEGLFDPAGKRSIPRFPRVVAIVTSETGAAIRDLISVLGRRAPHVDVVLRPARVQGEGAAEDIARGVAEVDAWGGADVLIVGRGGGSLEDLWAFNEETVARAIHASRTPVISAVGHEVDRTISDFAADLRAPTPSAAAELAAPDRTALLEDQAGTARRLAAAVTRLLRDRRDRAMLLSSSAAFREPLELYRRRSQDVDGLADRTTAAIDRMLERRGLRLTAASGRLSALSPLAVLERGYALARRADGRILRREGEVSLGVRVDVRRAKVEISCTVKSLREEIPEEAGENER
jgi:exodeoxyribonuclease VII large subunit